MAAERCGITVCVRGADRVSLVGGGVRGVCEQGNDTIVEPGNGAVRLCGDADGLCIAVAVGDPCGVGLADFFDGRLVSSPRHVRGAAERVVHDNGLDNGVEDADVRDRPGKHPEGTLDAVVLYKVSHGFFTSFSFVSFLPVRLGAPFDTGVWVFLAYMLAKGFGSGAGMRRVWGLGQRELRI